MAAPKKRTAAPKRRPATPKRRPTAKKRKTRTRKPLPPWLLLGGGLLNRRCQRLVFNVAKEVEWSTLWGNAQPPKTAASKPAETPRFDFYTILPNQEVVVPDPEPPAKKEPKAGDKKAKPVPEGVYYLQAGSFRNLDDANGMRAQVILLGTKRPSSPSPSTATPGTGFGSDPTRTWRSCAKCASGFVTTESRRC